MALDGAVAPMHLAAAACTAQRRCASQCVCPPQTPHKRNFQNYDLRLRATVELQKGNNCETRLAIVDR